MALVQTPLFGVAEHAEAYRVEPARVGLEAVQGAPEIGVAHGGRIERAAVGQGHELGRPVPGMTVGEQTFDHGSNSSEPV